jgi:nitrite reductase (NADH) large subunit
MERAHANPDRRIVVVGGGPAGVTAAEAARAADPEAAVHLIAAEPYWPYYRPRLSHAVGKTLKIEAIYIHPPSWYAERRIEVRLGRAATGIDVAGRKIVLDDGTELPFTALVLAQGGRAFLPTVPGHDLPGVFTLRRWADLEAIARWVGAARRGVVVGGGPLGLEIAWALRQWDREVTVLEMGDRLLGRQLDPRGAEILKEIATAKGVRALTGVTVEGLEGAERVTGVRVRDAGTLEAEFVIFAAGVVPEVGLARDAGLAVGRGIVVDEAMQTSHPDVFAAGDAAEFQGRVFGLWSVAVEQGRVAGTNAAGGQARYRPVAPSNVVQVLETSVFSVGQTEGPRVLVRDRGPQGYTRLVFEDGRLAGAVLIGDVQAGPRLKAAVDAQATLALRPDTTVEEALDRLGRLKR